MSYSRAHPSSRYLELQNLYRTMHERGESFLGIPPERTFPGSSLRPQAERIKRLIVQTGALAVLDYGSVKGRQYGSNAIRDDAGFRKLEIVDLSANIVRLANDHFSSIKAGVTARPGVSTYITDGRNFLMLQDRHYDVVSMELTSIWFAGAGALYNREFYQLVKRRLAPQGVLQQWMQLHHIHFQDILTILGSARAEFRYVWIYEIGGQGIIIAADSPSAMPAAAYLDKLDRTEALTSWLRLYGGSMQALPERRLLDPAGIDRLLAGFKLPPSHWVSTDDNLVLEYSTPRGNVLDGVESFRYNVSKLRRAAASAAN